VSDGADLSLHQQEVTDGQLVTMSLVPGTVDSDVASECHLCCPSPLPTGKVSSVDTEQLRARCLETELEKRKKEKVRSGLCLSVPLGKGGRVGTRLRGLQGVAHVVEVCLKGCYVVENVM